MLPLNHTPQLNNNKEKSTDYETIVIIMQIKPFEGNFSAILRCSVLYTLPCMVGGGILEG